MVEIKVNGKVVEAPAGANLLGFLNEELGLDVPHYCYHPAMTTVGSCRMCQVEFINRRQDAAGNETVQRVVGVSCRQPVQAGLEVETHSAAAREARRSAMEFLLANHPLDCPICDKAGECKLQDYAEAVEQLEGRTVEPRRREDKLVDLGEVILLDRERCILCTRCVRFFEEVEGRGQLGVIDRGDRSHIATFCGIPLEGNYQGNLADICPVGALTLKKFRFKQRVWDLEATPSTCPLCSRGCAIEVDTARETTVRRIRPRVCEEVNGVWICDHGRLTFDYLNPSEDRLLEGRIEGEPCSTDKAIAAAARLATEAGGGLLAVASPFLTNEDGLAFKETFDGAGTCAFYTPALDAEADRILRTDDPCPNRRGLGMVAGVKPIDAEDLEAALEEAELVWLAGDMLVELLPPGLIEKLKTKRLIYQGRSITFANRAAVAIPALSWVEKGGTWTNLEGHEGTLEPALPPPGQARSDIDIFAAVRKEAQL
jgi:NADH-quinone oxidoreductase subunit G